MNFISHCIKEKRQQFGDRAMLGVLSILVAFSLLGWVYLTQASFVAVTSRRVQELEAEKKRLQEQNLELMVEIAGLESVTRLSRRAQELGFVSASLDETEFLAVAEPQIPDQLLARDKPDNWWADMATQFTTWAQVGSQ